MSSQISPLFGPYMPREIKLLYFSFLPLSDLGRAGLVCKAWFELSKDSILWNPILKELDPLGNKIKPIDKIQSIRETVLEDLQKHQELVDKILTAMEIDQNLQHAFGHSSSSLSDLKAMLPIERSLHVMRALREDCTKLLVYLAQKQYVQTDSKNEDCQAGIRSLVDFCLHDPHLLLLYQLIQNPPGPFDASDVMSALIPSLFSFYTISPTMKMISCLVKAHRDLSKFFSTEITPRKDSFPIPAAEFTRFSIMRQMQLYDEDITIKDWEACGL